jgi:hypothetical protein
VGHEFHTVTHGYPAGSEGPVWIAFAQRADLMEVTYEDAGPPFDPLAEAAARPEDPLARSGASGGRTCAAGGRSRPSAGPTGACGGPSRPAGPSVASAGPRVRPQDPRVDEGEPLGGIGLAIVRGLSTSAQYARGGDRNRITLTVPGASAPSPDAGA